MYMVKACQITNSFNSNGFQVRPGSSLLAILMAAYRLVLVTIVLSIESVTKRRNKLMGSGVTVSNGAGSRTKALCSGRTRGTNSVGGGNCICSFFFLPFSAVGAGSLLSL